MKRYMFSIAILVLAFSLSPQQPGATTVIDTGIGGFNFSPFGSLGSEDPSSTVGQTFTVSGPDTQLDSFSLYLRTADAGNGETTLDLRGYVASWDSVNGHPSTILFSSNTQTMNAAGTLQEFAFAPGGVGLIAGQQYVAFLSVSDLPPQSRSLFWVPLAESSLNGGFLTYRSALTFAELTSNAWVIPTDPNTVGNDLAFKASLSAPGTLPAVPEPASLLLLGAGLLGLGLTSWRHGGGSTPHNLSA